MEKSQELIEIRVIEETAEVGNASTPTQINPKSIQEESKEVIKVVVEQNTSLSAISTLEIGTNSVNVTKSIHEKSNKSTIPTRPTLPISTTSSHRSTVILEEYGQL